jgi:hypothetical protein
MDPTSGGIIPVCFSSASAATVVKANCMVKTRKKKTDHFNLSITYGLLALEKS